MRLRDLIDRCSRSTMMTIYVPDEINPMAMITGTVFSILEMVSDTVLEYQVDTIDLDENEMEIRLTEED